MLHTELTPKLFLGFGGIVVLIDSAMHDFARLNVPWMRQYRSHIYTGIASICIAAIFPPPDFDGSFHAHWIYLLSCAAGACALAVADTYSTHVRPRKEKQSWPELPNV
jgi:hypothetical protein